VAAQDGLAARETDLLPVGYFHLVFTLPAEIAPLAYQNKAVVYDLLFRIAAETLLTIAADPKHLGARIGILAVLHTWSQTLLLHPHLHCIVAGGGLSPDGQQWVAGSQRFLLPVRVLTRMFRGQFLAGLKDLHQKGRLRLSGGAEDLRHPVVFQDFLDSLYRKVWMVYSKPPFGSPEQVLGYLARYTHRVALSNRRLVCLEADQVTFTYKDYRQESQIREMTLPAEEFLRRFVLHILPDRFVRIRHYGLFANRRREKDLEQCRSLLGVENSKSEPSPREDWQSVVLRVTGRDPTLCPECGRGHLRVIRELAPFAEACSTGRSPP